MENPPTTAQLQREIQWLRELLEGRMDSSDRAVELVQSIVNKSPTIAEIFAKHEQMFQNIQTQFSERDTRTEQTSRDSKVAVDAALQAAKEAVGEQNKSSALAIAKSEAATTKQIDQIGVTFQTMERALNDKVSDLKDRITAREGHSKGLGDGWGYFVGAIGLLLMVGEIVVLMMRH
jgi:ABC-type Fe2+-enterobactin transport system substrate-binding protein